MFDQRKPFMDELFELSWKLKKRHIYGLRVFITVTYSSATIKKKYKLKIELAEQNQN